MGAALDRRARPLRFARHRPRRRRGALVGGGLARLAPYRVALEGGASGHPDGIDAMPAVPVCATASTTAVSLAGTLVAVALENHAIIMEWRDHPSFLTASEQAVYADGDAKKATT